MFFLSRFCRRRPNRLCIGRGFQKFRDASPIHSSFRYASPHLWNQLPVSFRQPCTKHPADDVTLSNSPPTYSPLSPPSHIHCSIPGSKLTFSTNLFHHSFPPGLPSRTILDRTYSAQRFSIFSLIFFFGSCGRLSWLNCQLSSAR